MYLIIDGDIQIDLTKHSISFSDDIRIRPQLSQTRVSEIAQEVADNSGNKLKTVTNAFKYLLPFVIKYGVAGKYDPILKLLGDVKEVAAKKIAEKSSTLVQPEPQEPPPAAPNTLDSYDLFGLRKERVNADNLRKAPVNISLGNKVNLQDIRWSEPAGFKKGVHGFMVVGFKDKKVIYRSETHASHGRSTSFLNDEKPDNADADEVMIVWVNFEGRGDSVYGRSEPRRVK